MDSFPAILMLKGFLSPDSCIDSLQALFSHPGARQWGLSDGYTIKAPVASGIQSVFDRDAFVGGPWPLPPQHIDTLGPGTSFARVVGTLPNLSPTLHWLKTDLPFLVLSLTQWYYSVTVVRTQYVLELN